jgi:hypothetical protein
MGLTPALLRVLEASKVVVRGPKPTAALGARKVRIDLSADDSFTAHEALARLHATPLRGKCAVVQRYGESNRKLEATRGRIPGTGSMVRRAPWLPHRPCLAATAPHPAQGSPAPPSAFVA